MQDVETQIPENDSVTATDRFALTLFFAVAAHAMIILGITFGIDRKSVV